MTRALLTITAAASLAASTAAAQPPASPAPAATAATAATRTAITLEMVEAGVAAARRPNPPTQPFQTMILPGRNQLVASYFISIYSEREGYKALLTLLEARMDKQVGAAPTNNASTSLATKGLVPELLGFAVETGALQRETKGTALTFRAKPMGVIKALQGRGLLEMYADYSRRPGVRYASRFSAAAGFDTSKGSSAGTFTADTQQFTSWSLRYELINGRDPASPQYADLWKALGNDSADYANATSAVFAALAGWPEFTAWEKALLEEVNVKVDTPLASGLKLSEAAATFKTILEAALPKLEKLPNPPAAVKAALDGYVAQLTAVQKSIDKIYAFAGKGALVTFDWTTTRSTTLPDLYTSTGIVECSLGAARKTDFTLNVVANFYREKPANAAQAFKSFEMTGQLEHPLGSSFLLPAATAALAGRYTYLPKDTVAATGSATGAATAPKGSIWMVQGKLTVPVKGGGVKVPLSVTAANRTELIKEKINLSAAVGLTFDLDTWLTALSAREK